MSISAEQVRRIYCHRPLAAGHPDIRAHELAALSSTSALPRQPIMVVLTCIQRVIDLHDSPKRAVVLGCGPTPQSLRQMLAMRWEAKAVEPVEEFALAARDFVGKPDAVLSGSAERLPLDDGSQTIVIMESVLEHVDSPAKALDEAYRVLAPGGVLYVTTTNRLRTTNGEYTVPFFQWLPRLLKESYIHQHLHFEPHLARYTSRPAVHWFSYADLCSLGRTAGFYRFYGRLDLLSTSDATVRTRRLRGFALDRVRYNPWLRSIALTQRGGTVFMLKRSV